MAATTEHEKIELSEQTPLKSDTDAPATNDQSAPSGGGGGDATTDNNATTDADKSKKGGFKLFHFGSKGHKSKSDETAKDDETKPIESEEKVKDVNEKEKVHDIKKKEKKSSWWNRNRQKICNNDPTHPDNQHGTMQQGQLSYGVNLIQRDDHGLHTSVDFGFEDIYGEPDSAHSLAGVWRANHCVFLAVRNFFYKLFSALLVLPLAVVFGILFALVSAFSVFVCVPAGRLISIPANYVFKAWNFVISSVFDPVFHAIGQSFTNVRISRYGINSDPTAVLTA